MRVLSVLPRAAPTGCRLEVWPLRSLEAGEELLLDYGPTGDAVDSWASWGFEAL